MGDAVSACSLSEFGLLNECYTKIEPYSFSNPICGFDGIWIEMQWISIFRVIVGLARLGLGLTASSNAT
jgi:hypothetical protein